MGARVSGQRIKQRREELKLSQERLAELVGISQKNISDYERGHQTNLYSDTLVKLAQELNVPIAYLFEEDAPSNSEQALLEAFRALPTQEARAFAIELLTKLEAYARAVDSKKE